MRFLRSHHITKVVAVVDSFLPRAAANPKGGRPLILHPNEVVALLLFSGFVAPQRHTAPSLVGGYKYGEFWFSQVGSR